VDTLFSQLLDLHRRRWQARDEPGMLSGPLEPFHREVVRRFQTNGLLRLYALYLDDAPAAAFYGFATPRRTVFYVGGFDPRFERFSPGMLVIAHAIQRALVEGAAEFDFLRGAEAYKYRWGAIDRELYRCNLEPEAHRVA
jgi:CelD/BcsL family acetyltransferase involved in cellulose biosynthesis